MFFWPLGINQAATGARLRIRGVEYEHGLGMRTPCLTGLSRLSRGVKTRSIKHLPEFAVLTYEFTKGKRSMKYNSTLMKEALREFNDQGYTVLRGVIDAATLDAAQSACERLVDELALRRHSEGKADNLHPNEPFTRRMIRLYEHHPDETPAIFRQELHLPGFFGLFAHLHMLDFAEQLVGSEVRLYPNYSVRPKMPDSPRTEVLWHQDAGYTAADADTLRMMNVWVPLVKADRHNGCMEFVPGSHRQGVVAHEQDKHYLRIADEVIRKLEARAVAIEAAPCDAVLFSNLLFHRGLPNRSDHIRWSLDFRYQDATQPTMRQEHGYLLRSQQHPAEVVRDATHWSSLRFE